MIGKLTGKVDSLGSDWVIVDVGGVGYVVSCSGRTLGQMGTGDTVALLIDTHVREDQIALFGFADQAERDWFRLLTNVQGVGGKVGLAILTVISVDQLVNAIAAEDKKVLTRASGVGARLATRIVTELRDRVAEFSLAEPSAAATPANDADPGETRAVARDAVSALVNLGYGRADAFGAITNALRGTDGDVSLETLLRAGLRELSA